MVDDMVMTLSEWLREPKKSAEQFGKELGVSGQAVRRWCSGERMPDAEMIERIVGATSGQVTIQDIHETRLRYVRSQGSEAA